MKSLARYRLKDMSCENTSEIQSENNVDLKSLSPSHEETKPDRAENKAPAVHPDEQPSKSEARTTREQVNRYPDTTTSFELGKPFLLIESPQWLPKECITELRI